VHRTLTTPDNPGASEMVARYGARQITAYVDPHASREMLDMLRGIGFQVEGNPFVGLGHVILRLDDGAKPLPTIEEIKQSLDALLKIEE
jgi:hypothetical protein